MRNRPRNTVIAALVVSASLLGAACSSSSNSDTTAAPVADTTAAADTSVAVAVETTAASATTAAPATTAAVDTTAATAAETTVAPVTTAASATTRSAVARAGAADTLGAFGPGCADVPTSGPGSFAAMAKVPAATAASNNPALSSFGAALTAAGLGDTLNGPGPFTIFAPSNDAFTKIGQATLDKLLADPKGDLTKILNYHVIPGTALKASELLTAGTEATVQGGEVTIDGSGADITLNGLAKVVCGDVVVGNGIVHIVDTVLMPG
jgi:uncharacterized surface protein with fasciclin (FAS1) repeats